MTVIVSELQFFPVKREFLRIYSVVFHQSFFGKWPEPLDTINVHLTVDESLAMIDSHMTETV